MKNDQRIIRRVMEFFVSSHDFNGIPGTTLSEELELGYQHLIDLVKGMVEQHLVSIQTGINPHIISLGHFPVVTQLKILEEARQNVTTRTSIMKELVTVSNSHEFCVYPSRTQLQLHRNVSEFDRSPFTQRLALAEPQLQAQFFDIDVLDRYYRDPRFSFDFDDYSGRISYREDANLVSMVSESDKVFMQTFGIGHDSNGNRLAVVYLRYLHTLTPEHQVYWKSKERDPRDCKMVKEYYDNTILGAWTFSHSIFSAVIHEQKALNDLAQQIFGIPLFRDTYEEEKRPKEFTFFFIPTLENFNNFILLLDKMISDNLNKDFFKNEVELFDFEELGNGQVERKARGTLRLLKEWLSKLFEFEQPNAVNIILRPLQETRKLRQRPAHHIHENVYDKTFLGKQKEHVESVYRSIRQLRHLFESHPDAIGVKIPDWLNNGAIKSF